MYNLIFCSPDLPLPTPVVVTDPLYNYLLTTLLLQGHGAPPIQKENQCVMTNGNTFHLHIYHLPLMVNSFLGIQKESVKKEMQEKCEGKNTTL